MKKFLFTLLVLAATASCNDEALSTDKAMTLTQKPPVAMETSMQEQTAEVRLTVPDSLWSIAITRVVQSQDHIAVIAQLTKSEGMGLMVISEVAAAVSFKAKPLPIKYVIVGKTWNWENTENYEFISEVSELDSIRGKDLAFTHRPPSHRSGPKLQEM